ncbi:unnamed protein product [Macrosiphum euphorbiae]|uniref:Uncharacterized protein n=1 Tax=Macrosiphum euphorbiae TaxID=13131 RepID=A0AAV0Y835_9HEMI|nr:unnamed protein product [Macrosiphum euphorbiae]CAI6376928.1 unnamed protein product [Macrosiphum euphorbiae]
MKFPPLRQGPASTISAEYALRGGCERVEEFVSYAELTSVCYKTDLTNSQSALPKGSHRIWVPTRQRRFSLKRLY